MAKELTQTELDLEKYTNNIKDKIQQAYTRFLEIGRLLNLIHDQELFKVKYNNFDEYLENEIEFARATCYQFKRIAKLVEQYKMDKIVNLGYKKMLLISTIENQNINLVKDNKRKEEKKKEFVGKLNNVTIDMTYDQIKGIFIPEKKIIKKKKGMTKSYVPKLLKDETHNQIIIQCEKEYLNKLFKRVERLFKSKN